MNKIIYSIGHSTRLTDELVDLLKKNGVVNLVDIRTYPSSKKFPQFNKDALERSIPKRGLNYYHMEKLGGMRKPNKNSHNTRWKKESFRAFADYMETDEFLKGIDELLELAADNKTAYMCAETVWLSCHRSMISDYLKSIGWTVLHIIDENNPKEHPYTEPAKIVDGKLSYRPSDLFDVFKN